MKQHIEPVHRTVLYNTKFNPLIRMPSVAERAVISVNRSKKLTIVQMLRKRKKLMLEVSRHRTKVMAVIASV